jgi:hypothetical protein
MAHRTILTHRRWWAQNRVSLVGASIKSPLQIRRRHRRPPSPRIFEDLSLSLATLWLLEAPVTHAGLIHCMPPTLQSPSSGAHPLVTDHMRLPYMRSPKPSLHLVPAARHQALASALFAVGLVRERWRAHAIATLRSMAHSAFSCLVKSAARCGLTVSRAYVNSLRIGWWSTP